MSEPNEVTPQANQTPVPAGQPVVNVDELKARIEQLEREKQGIFSDLKSEREKRQMYERAQIATASTNSVPASTPNSPEVVNPLHVVKPLYDEVVAMRSQTERDQALLWFAKKEKIEVDTPDEVLAAPSFKELQSTISKYRLDNMPMLEGVKAAHKLLLLEREEANKAKLAQEQTRDNNIVAQPVSSVGAPAQMPKVVKMSRTDIAKMDVNQYLALKEKAAKNGETIHVE